MCAPMAIAYVAMAAATVYSAQQQRKSAKEAAAAQSAAQGDPAAERAKAEAEAAQRANAQLADANRRRREQSSLMSKGATAPTFTLGDSSAGATDPASSPLTSGSGMNRSTVARQAVSLMSTGAPAGSGGALGGGRSTPYKMQQL